jgi:hypothetical protein
MENQISLDNKQNEIALKQELENTINVWVDRTFNFIQVAVLEKYTEDCLFEYIRNISIGEMFYDWLVDSDSTDKILSWMNDLKIENDLLTYHEHKGSIEESFVFVFGEQKWEEFKYWCCEEYEDDIQTYIYEQDNYPMWNTCFEFRNSFYNSEENVMKCLSVGLGVIEGLDDFNNILFMKSAGHSFYSAYWIPLYLKLFPNEAEKYAGINYQDL